ncbi:hypothetical protein [Tritonibacter mobilis]|uniref:hypothetical protein n=1 Tax=Tritonibacter mobilis TaxID=379347 RepID=UPI000F7F9E3C|nr:hypothetical protein [Tritonibacter mobilis]
MRLVIACIALAFASPSAPAASDSAEMHKISCLAWGLDRFNLTTVNTKLSELRTALELQKQPPARMKMAQEVVESLTLLIDGLDGVNASSDTLYASACPVNSPE